MQHIMAIGEVLWDIFPEQKKVGGAPGNFAYHAQKLGAKVRMISRVGDDELGHALIDFYQACGLSTENLTIDTQYPTGAVDVTFVDGQPHYTFRDNVAWDHMQADETSLALAQKADAICFGTLAARNPESRIELHKLILAAPPTALRIFDINLRPPHYDQATISELLELADVLKLNNDEIDVVCKMLGFQNDDLMAQAVWLREKYDFRLLILTLGSQGSILLNANEVSQYQSKPVQVVDTVGAGDAFTAAAIIGFLDGKSLDEINRIASELAAYVCTQAGGMPDYDPCKQFDKPEPEA